MGGELPVELLDQANFLLTLPPNQANLCRAAATAYTRCFTFWFARPS
jgi:hypothetical protein